MWGDVPGGAGLQTGSQTSEGLGVAVRDHSSRSQTGAPGGEIIGFWSASALCRGFRL